MLVGLFKDKDKIWLNRAAAQQAATTIRRPIVERGAAASAAIDIAFLDIGENGHIAFNDPPADFTTEDPYIIVTLDEAFRCRQVGEAWFAEISQVPKRAISMSPRHILKAKEILLVVPEKRKVQAVKDMPGWRDQSYGSGLWLRHRFCAGIRNATVYVDENSASLLSPTLQRALTDDGELAD
jgi:glucosamine-6-phosphate deaminase